jgi:hypothetical protein
MIQRKRAAPQHVKVSVRGTSKGKLKAKVVIDRSLGGTKVGDAEVIINGPGWERFSPQLKEKVLAEASRYVEAWENELRTAKRNSP